MKFIIDRSQWRCGSIGPHAHGKGFARLLNAEGYYCCLGMISEQLGQTDLLDCAMPADLEKDYLLVNKLRCYDDYEDKEYDFYDDTDLSLNAAKINDNSELTDEQRESQLIELFAKEGHEIQFIGEYGETTKTV